MIKRRLEMIDSEMGISPAAESMEPTIKRQEPRKTTVADLDFDDAPEEVSEIRPVQKRREPKIVPPVGGEEMLRRRQELVRRRAQGEKVPQPKKAEAPTNWDVALGQTIKQSLQQLSGTLESVKALRAREHDSPGYNAEVDMLTKELFHHRDELDALMMTLHKKGIGAGHAFRSTISRSLMDLEDALHDIHK